MNYDMTYCSNYNCNRRCFRNQNNIPKNEIYTRGGIWVATFPKCEYFKEDKKDESKNN